MTRRRHLTVLRLVNLTGFPFSGLSITGTCGRHEQTHIRSSIPAIYNVFELLCIIWQSVSFILFSNGWPLSGKKWIDGVAVNRSVTGKWNFQESLRTKYNTFPDRPARQDYCNLPRDRFFLVQHSYRQSLQKLNSLISGRLNCCQAIKQRHRWFDMRY